jgi:hypothetical protein
MALRSCLVSCRDLAGTEHALEVTAESLYEGALCRRLPLRLQPPPEILHPYPMLDGGLHEEEEADGAGEGGGAGAMIRGADCASARNS